MGLARLTLCSLCTLCSQHFGTGLGVGEQPGDGLFVDATELDGAGVRFGRLGLGWASRRDARDLPAASA